MNNIKSTKREASLDSLIALAQKELFQFKYNDPKYTVQQLIDFGLESKIPNLIKLDKKVECLVIRNNANYPVLHIKYKKPRN